MLSYAKQEFVDLSNDDAAALNFHAISDGPIQSRLGSVTLVLSS